MANLKPFVKPIATIICDDIRREDNGKGILIGVYSGDILVKEFPTVLKLSLWIIVKALGSDTFPLEIEILDAERKSLINGRVMATVSGEEEEEESSVAFPHLPLLINSAGPIEVRWKVGKGKNWHTLMTKKILLQEGSTHHY